MNREEQKALNIFISESVELLQEITDDLLVLEENLDNPDIINRLFRNLHTLKGGAALEGLNKISNVAHLMEDIFGIIRDTKIPTPEEYIDLFLDANDLLKDLVESIGSSNYDDIEVDEIHKKLKEVKEKMEPDKGSSDDGSNKVCKELSLNDEEITSIINAEGYNIFKITCKFKPDDQMKPINSFIIFNNMRSFSNYIKSAPSETDMRNKVEFDTLEILIKTEKEKDEIIEKLKSNCSDPDVKILNKNELESFKIENDAEKEKSLEDVIDGIMEEYSNTFLKDIENENKLWLIELNFKPDDPMKGIMALLIYNNIKDKSYNIVGTMTTVELQKNTSFTKLLIYVTNKLSKETIENLIKINCASFNITELTSEDLITPEKKGGSDDNNKQTNNTQTSQVVQAYLEVDKEILDGLIENIGELVLSMNSLAQDYNDMMESNIEDFDELKMRNMIINGQLNATMMICNSLMDYAVLLKLVPVNQIFKKYPRIVRDLSKKIGKKVKLKIEGERTRIDQEILEALEGPLVHMIRNSLDHGIEEESVRKECNKPPAGTITLKATQKRDRVHIEISDDGKGLDKDKILAKALKMGLLHKDKAKTITEEDIYSFIYHPGFSTTDKVSQISGRGVGMDVVATEIHKVGGTITIYSTKGEGTRIVLDLPIAN